MNGVLWWGWAAAAAVLLCVFCLIAKGGHPVRGLIYSGLQGVGALLAVNIAGIFSGVTLAVNALTLFGCTVFGVPGVVALLLLKTVFSVG